MSNPGPKGRYGLVKQAVFWAYENGRSAAEAGLKFGFSARAMHAACRRYGVALPRSARYEWMGSPGRKPSHLPYQYRRKLGKLPQDVGGRGRG